MNRTTSLALAVSFTALLPAQAPPKAGPVDDSQILAEVVNRFGADLAARRRDPNLCQSPASVGLCLLMLLPGARGGTADELRKLLCPDGWDERRMLAAASALLAHLRGAKTIELSVVHDLWPRADQPLLPPFLAATKAAFGAEVRGLDYGKDPAAARKVINDHVAKATRGRITDLLPQAAVRENTRLVLTNALYLKADWRQPFGDTREGSFHLADGSKVTVPLMHETAPFALAEVEGLQVLRLHYVDQEFALDVALPAKGMALAKAEATLTSGMAGWKGALAVRAVEVTLPRFRVENQFSLVGDLQALGLVLATSDRADFSGVGGGLFINQVVHKTFFDVAEKGTEAAAATAVTLADPDAVAPAPRFTADRPFAFALRDLATGLVLFAGRVADPRPVKS